MKEGDQFTMRWNDGQMSRYLVVAVKDSGGVLARRWIEHKNKWTDWTFPIKARQLNRFKLST